MHYRFGEFDLDTTRETLTGPDGEVPLRPLTWRLLRHLVENAPALISQNDLIDSLWGHDALSPNVITQTVSALRQALGDDAQNPKFIETRPRRGYAFIAPMIVVDDDGAPVDAVEAHAAAAAKGNSSPVPIGLRMDSTRGSVFSPPVSAHLPIWRRPSFLLAAVSILVAVIAIGIFFGRNGSTVGSGGAGDVRPVVSVTADDAHADLAALTRLMLRDGDSLVVLTPDSPTLAAGSAASLTIEKDGNWMIAGSGGDSLAAGRLTADAVATQARELDAAVRAGLQVRSSPGARVGWPRDDAAMTELAAGMAAYERGNLATAIPALRNVMADVDGSSLPRLVLARALVHAGDWNAAQAVAR